LSKPNYEYFLLECCDSTGLTLDDKKCFKKDIIRHIIRATQDIVTTFSSEGDQGKQFLTLTLDALRSIGVVDASTVSNLNADIASSITTIWQDQHFRSLYEKSPYFCEGLEGNATQCKNFPRWGGEDWIPTNDDILRCNIRTSGVHECRFTVDGLPFKFIDFDGIAMRRAVARKMIQSVSNVVFVAALSDYDETLPDAPDRNALLDALKIFKALLEGQKEKCNAIDNPILVLNKADKFHEKLCKRKVPLNVSGEFPDAPRTFDFSAGIDWIRQEFLKQVDLETCDLQIYVVNALDMEDVRVTFDQVIGSLSYAV